LTWIKRQEFGDSVIVILFDKNGRAIVPTGSHRGCVAIPGKIAFLSVILAVGQPLPV
jgi:hypothetical protein